MPAGVALLPASGDAAVGVGRVTPFAALVISVASCGGLLLCVCGGAGEGGAARRPAPCHPPPAPHTRPPTHHPKNSGYDLGVTGGITTNDEFLKAR